MKLFSNIILLCFLFSTLSGQITDNKIEYFAHTDSIFVHINETNGVYQAIHLYTLKPKNTLYSLSKWFGAPIEKIKANNPQLLKRMPQLGDTISLPIAYSHLLIKSESNKTDIPVCYQVSKGETLYALAKRYFDVTVDEFKRNANLSSDTLAVRQTIVLGYLPSISPYPMVEEKEKPVSVDLNSSVKPSYIEQKGIALWKDGPTDGAPFALHREAKIGSVLRVINPMFNSEVEAKVVGRLPKKMYTEDVTIILSPNAAKTLGALDKRFYVRVRYIK